MFTREEISKRFLPFLYRQINPFIEQEHLEELLNYYCLSESLNKDITYLIPATSNSISAKQTETDQVISNENTIALFNNNNNHLIPSNAA